MRPRLPVHFWGSSVDECFPAGGNQHFEFECLYDARREGPWGWDDAGALTNRCCRGFYSNREQRWLYGNYGEEWVQENKWLTGCDASAWDMFFLQLKVTSSFVSNLEFLRAPSSKPGGDFLGLERAVFAARDEGFACPLGQNLYEYLVYMTIRDGSEMHAETGFLLGELQEKLRKIENEISSAALFEVVGMTTTMLQYILFDTHSSSELPDLRHPWLQSSLLQYGYGRELIIDLGMDNGLDSLFYLNHGYDVVGVEPSLSDAGHMVTKLLVGFNTTTRPSLTLLHAAVVGGGLEVRGTTPVWLFASSYSPHSSLIQQRGFHKNSNQGPLLNACHLVPGWSCAALLVEYQPVLYMKIDVEGLERACIASLPKAVQVGVQPPRFLSVELPILPYTFINSSARVRASKLISSILRHLSEPPLTYRRFKVCRQKVYSGRCWGTNCQTGATLPFPWHGEASVAGTILHTNLVASGPFGDRAVDWLTGEAWRSLSDVKRDLLEPSVLAQLSADLDEVLDLHVAL